MEGGSSSNCNTRGQETESGEYIFETNTSRISQMTQQDADKFYQHRKNQILKLLRENSSKRLKRSNSAKISPTKQKANSRQITPRLHHLISSANVSSPGATPRSGLASSRSSASTMNLQSYRKFDVNPNLIQRADVRNISPDSLKTLQNRMNSVRRAEDSSSKYDISKPIYDRQVQWLNNIKEKSETEFIEKTKAELENCTFKPFKNSKRSSKSPTEMYDTQVRWKDQIDKRLKNLHTKKELENIQECHFQPNIRKGSPNVNFQDFYKRLSDWNDKKQQKIHIKAQAIMENLLKSERKQLISSNRTSRSPRCSNPNMLNNNEDLSQFQSSLTELKKIIQKKQPNMPKEKSQRDYFNLALPKHPNKVSNSVASDIGLIMRFKNLESYIQKLEQDIDSVKII